MKHEEQWLLNAHRLLMVSAGGREVVGYYRLNNPRSALGGCLSAQAEA
jgi:hypothetical protein